MVSPMKSPNMMSITGRMPVIAAPTAMPVKPASEIGVSSTRLGAELFHQAGEHFERMARFGDIFAQNKDARVAAHLFGQRFADGLRQGQFANGSGSSPPLFQA